MNGVTASQRPPVLAVSALHAHVGDLSLLRNINLQVRSGELVGLFGPSGAGKTSLFRALIGQLETDSGSVHLAGMPVTGMPLSVLARYGLGYVPQSTSLLRSLSVEQNLMLAIEMIDEPRRRQRERLQMLMAQFGLGKVRHTRAGALSGGERRRCEIARALTGDPHVLLLDEPFAGIDPIGIEQVCRLLRRIAARGVAILLTDHNLHQALPAVDRAYVMESGEIIACGSMRDILEDATVRQRYLGASFRV